MLKLCVSPARGAAVDVWAETGEVTAEAFLHRPHMEVLMHLTYDPGDAPNCLHEVAASLHQTCRHEIEHLLDEGLLALPGPGASRRRLPHQEAWQDSIRLMHWINARRTMFAEGPVTPAMWSRLDERLLRESSDAKCRILQYMVSPREMHAFVMGFHAEARFRRVGWEVPMMEYLGSMIETGRMDPREAEAAQQMMTRWAERVIPRAAGRPLLTEGGSS